MSSCYSRLCLPTRVLVGSIHTSLECGNFTAHRSRQYCVTGSGGRSTCLLHNACFSKGDLLFECPEDDERCSSAGGRMPEVRGAAYSRGQRGGQNKVITGTSVLLKFYVISQSISHPTFSSHLIEPYDLCLCIPHEEGDEPHMPQ